MATSDALIVGEDWISEHYFATDAKSGSFQAKVTERRKAWDEDAKTVRGDGDPESRVDTVRSRFLTARVSLSADIASLIADTPEVADAHSPTCTPASARCSATTPASTRSSRWRR